MSDETDLPEHRDDATFSMFSDEETGAGEAGYQVLARKYRPRLFSDLIGQEAMVRTLENAFETGRIAHAFMMTGVRGVGKTTTARLLASGLNYVGENGDGPSTHLDPPGEHCQAIMESRHPDVLELDAASRTGVSDMRELLDGVRYAPVSARYKVYIIDEVHMLSTAAFNALLKTLEEPPPHVKFIFATTEIRKVPVTVLSRCQRFDLKRLDVAALTAHLGRIADKEGASISEEGLGLIARAAEGSVRDGLSILDQAIVQAIGGEPVSAEIVRDMLGLGDRGRLLDVFDLAVSGDGKGACEEALDQLRAGADPLIVLKDLLDICAEVATAQIVGEDYAPPGPSDWVQKTRAISQRISQGQATRFWQILLSGYKDAQSAPMQDTAMRMVILRLSVAARLPSPEDAAQMLAEGGGANTTRATGKDTPPQGDGPVSQIDSFEQVAWLLETRREAILSGQVESYLVPVEVGPGRIRCAVKEGAPPDLLGRLSAFLEAETDQPWKVELAESGGETIKERAARIHQEKVDAAAKHPVIAAALAAMPGAEIIEVRQEGPAQDGAQAEIVPLKDRARS